MIFQYLLLALFTLICSAPLSAACPKISSSEKTLIKALKRIESEYMESQRLLAEGKEKEEEEEWTTISLDSDEETTN